MDGTIERAKCPKKTLNRVLGAENTLLDSEKRKEIEKDKKEKITLLKI